MFREFEKREALQRYLNGEKVSVMGESCYRLEDIGRIVFLTHEEAERKLEEMKNND